MKISIVIPVYNEAAYLDACLESIATQTVKPYEVIVVNNNSTDNSAIVAAKYDFVTLINEPKQGVIHARTTGFNAARGDVIGRIDADTTLPSDWTETVVKIFDNSNVDAVSGCALYYDINCSGIGNKIDLLIRRVLSDKMQNHLFLWGANMAVRRDAWQAVRSLVCTHGHIHEDQDLAIHLQEQGRRVIFAENLKARVSWRRINSGFMSFISYAQRGADTYGEHKTPGKVYLQLMVAVAAVGYLPVLFIHRSYNPVTGRFSWKGFKRKVVPRVDPTSNTA